MKSPFDIVNDILFSKKSDKLLPCDDVNQFLINRIISYQSPQLCQLINNTTNHYHGVLDSQQLVDFLTLVIPKNKWKRLDWLPPKKEKMKKATDSNMMQQLCHHMELSKTDLLAALEIFPELLKKFEDDEKIYKKIEN